MDVPAVEMISVCRSFGDGGAQVTALRDLSVSIKQGAQVAVIGPSGSGKTTFLNLAGALDRPSAGTVNVLGRVVSSFSERAASAFRREKMGFIFQDDALIPEITVFENVELPLVLLRRPSRERQKRVRNLLERLLLGDRVNSFPAMLSAGEKQRVAVARAVVHGPELLLGDEPTSHLDTHAAEAVIQTMEDLTRDNGITTVVATHDPRVYSKFRTHIKLVDGQLESMGTERLAVLSA